MRILNQIKVAARSLNKNKLRTFLTMLGIIIGVGSVIAMLAIGEGSRQNIQASVASLGTNSIMIYPGSMNQGGVRMGAGSYSTLTVKDAEAIAARCDLVTLVTPAVSRSVQVIDGAQNWRTFIVGSNIEYLAIRNLAISSGSAYTLADDRAAAKVCIIGQTVSDNIFGPGKDPIGQSLRINSIPFRVIGLLEKKGQNTFGQDQDDIIIAPFSTVQKRLMTSSKFVSSIYASGSSEKVIDKAKDEIGTILREQHKLTLHDDDDFTVRSQADIANIFGSISKIMTILLASIAGISLLVGGIGIMNIMLVSVTERTREIGIRMAIGAKGRDVLIQFMIEAVFISFLGGLIGVGLGMITAGAVATFGGWPVVITSSSILLSFAFSAAVGIFFGWYPARKAAGLNPIDALRYE